MIFADHLFYFVYLLILGVGFLVSYLILGPRVCFDIRRIPFIYFAFMFVTFWLRPAIVYGIYQDEEFLMHLHQYYEFVAFDKMDLVFLSLFLSINLVVFSCSFRSSTSKIVGQIRSATSYPNRGLVRIGYWLLISLGYFGFLVSSSVGGQMISTEGGTGIVGTTGYVFLLNYMVVSGVLLRFIVSGQLLSSLFLSFPWAVVHLMNGFNRYIVITLFIGFFLLWTIRGGHLKWYVYCTAGLAAPIIVYGFALLSANRGAFTSSERLEVAQSVVAELPWHNSLRDFAGFEGSLITIDRTLKGYDVPVFGTNLIYKILVWPIPRIFWTAKPYPTEFTWDYILSFGEDREYSYHFTTLFTGWFVRGSVGFDIYEWGTFFFWVNSLILGLLAGFIEKRCLVPNGHPILLTGYVMFYASFVYIGRQTIYENGGPLIYALYTPLLLLYFITAWRVGYRQPRLS